MTVNGKLTNNPADVAEALNYYFVDSVVTISQCFSPKYSEVYTVNTVEQALTLRAVSELDVTRKITSLKPSRAKEIFGMDRTVRAGKQVELGSKGWEGGGGRQ